VTKEDGVRQRRSMKAKLISGDGPLSRVPPIAVFVVVVAVFAAGVIVRGVPGAVLLGVLAAGVALMLAATWETLAPGQRFARTLILGLLIIIAVSLVLVK
jgi:uncharacterized protein DUF6703